MSVYRDIYEKISTSTPAQAGQAGPLWRILKIQEEAGEAAEAVINYAGVNARKDQVLDEGRSRRSWPTSSSPRWSPCTTGYPHRSGT